MSPYWHYQCERFHLIRLQFNQLSRMAKFLNMINNLTAINILDSQANFYTYQFLHNVWASHEYHLAFFVLQHKPIRINIEY